MKRVKAAVSFLKNWGSAIFDYRKILGLAYFPRYVSHYMRYRSLVGGEKIKIEDSFPCLSDWIPYTPFDPHYFHQGLWLAQRLSSARPEVHVDVGSSISAISVISAFVPTVFLDYRPLKVSTGNLMPVAGDCLCLPFRDKQLISLSCLHVIEHIGLGRYGEPLNRAGTISAGKELSRVLGHGGSLYLSVPVGIERTQFNAQRIYHATSILKIFNQLKLTEFSLVDDMGNFIYKADIAKADECEYGCGLFLFQR